MNETADKQATVDETKDTEFHVGDAVVHPIRGAGKVTGFTELETQGELRKYYKIKLIKQTSTSLMIPIDEVDEVGMRPAISPENLDKVWSILQDTPEELPSNYRTRHKVINDSLQTGDIFEIAVAVRDTAWRREGEDGLTQKGKELYKRGIRLLAGEIAASKGIPLSQAQRDLKKRLREAFKAIRKAETS
jgi:CarD family transcriptional regulator